MVKAPQLTYHALKKKLMIEALQELEEVIASGLDKKRFYLKDKRTYV